MARPIEVMVLPQIGGEEEAVARLFCNARHNEGEGQYQVIGDECVDPRHQKKKSERTEKNQIPSPNPDRGLSCSPDDEQKRDRIDSKGQCSEPIRHAWRDLIHALFVV